MISAQNPQRQLSGSKNLLLLILLAFSIQSCSVFEDIFGSKRTPPPPPPPIEEVDPNKPGGEVADTTNVTVIEPEEKDTIVIPPPVVEKEQINLAIILPFQLDQMDSSNSFPQAAKNSLQLYKGIQLALQEANFTDKELNLYVLDNQGNEEKTLSLLQKHPFPKVDAVIGPLYPNVMNRIGDFAKEQKIPFISPLSSRSDLGSNNPYIFSSIANTQTRYGLMLDFIDSEFINPNIGVFYQSVKKEVDAKNELLAVASKKGIEVKEQEDEGSIFTSVESLLESGRENIIITNASVSNEGDIYYFNNFLYSLNEKGKTHSIKIFSTKEWNDVKALAPGKYPNLSFYLIDRFLDGTNTTKSSEFKELISRNKNNNLFIYSYQGYDLMSYIIELVDAYGKDFPKHLYDTEYQGIQTKYQFDKLTTENGFLFYDNKHINILRYNGGLWQKVN